MKLWDIKNSNTFRVLFIGLLVLLLLIPMQMVKSVIHERGNLYRQANEQVTLAWGGRQLLAGPVLTLPYIVTNSVIAERAYQTRYTHVRPSALTLTAAIDTEIRYRGIYPVPVYTTSVLMQGSFSMAAALVTDQDPDILDLAPDKGRIQFPVFNADALKAPVALSWDGEPIELQVRRDGTAAGNAVIFTAELPASLLSTDSVHTFELTQLLAGSGELGFISPAEESRITVNADWASPGFYGKYLPASHTITDEAFTASWTINDVFTEAGHTGSEFISAEWLRDQPRFGVRLVQPVDTYQVVTRAAKYAILFIGLTFLIYFFVGQFGGVSLHPVQYLLVGVANCIFYLLLLSLAEHIHFNLAYLISAFASTALISLYSISILKRRSMSAIVLVTLTGLYSYLFVTLRSEDYALLIGSIGLFVILGSVMYLSRNVDWNRPSGAA